MKTHMLYLLAVSILCFNSCKPAQTKTVHLRKLEFKGEGLKVITSSVNEKSGTMSLLYGNESALAYSIKGNDIHQSGEIFKQVTYKQQDHELWYGSKINGALLYVETIKTIRHGESIIPVYTIEYYGETKPDQIAGTRFILKQRASVFP
ncbi:hypothetical protein [Pedobacter lusitanus]|uniref:hypothetical protein n=1 Tax=Pedobacter lusitanus TaxID=1503925 RepID=UPI0006976AAD|nr:hypothetical protein [Pedobacter lusitanus]